MKQSQKVRRARQLLWLTPVLAALVYLLLYWWQSREQWAPSAPTVCGKQQIKLSENRRQESVEGWVQVTSKGDLLLSPKSDPLPWEKMALAVCGDGLERGIHSRLDDFIRTHPPGDAMKINVWGQCVPHETPWCMTFLVEELVVMH